MMDAATFLKSFFDFLNQNAEYAVLRNFEGLPYRNDSRDIDIAIEKSTLTKLRPQLIGLIEECGWKIVTYLKSDRLITWVCGSIHEDKTINLVQLDFFYHTSVFGIVLIENKDILANRQFNGNVFHANKIFEFLDKYVYDRVVGAEYPEKYLDIRHAIEQDPNVLEVIAKLFKKNSLTECDRASKKELLKTSLRWNFSRYGLMVFVHYLKFIYYHILNYVQSCTGFSIGFTGPDGSGKTTVIELMIEHLGAVFRKAHVYYHFRPMLFGNLGEVAHSTGLKKNVDRNYDEPHRGGKTGMFNSLFRLLYSSIDYFLGYFVRVKALTRITRLVIFDRYYTDIICDSRRSRIYLSTKFLYWFGRLFIPSLDYNILLTANTETILSRKQELDREDIETINDKIDYLATKPTFYKILNERAPQDAVVDILRLVFYKQHMKNLKRLKYAL